MERFRRISVTLLSPGNGTYVCLRILFVLLVITATAAPVGADIYMYIDEDGNYYFTDTPPSSKYKLFIKEPRPKPVQLNPARRYEGFIQEASRQYDVDARLLTAIMKAESNFNPQAVSNKGAKGLMQIMPENFRALNIENPFDPRENIMGGTRYFRQLLNQFDGDLPLALAAYNAGPTIVDRGNGIPRIRETENFVERVLKYYQQLKQIGN